MATLLRLNRNEDLMSKSIIHNISKVAELENPAGVERHNFSDERPVLADLVLPGTGYKFSDEFACVLRVLGGEIDFA
jgi:hypothetical protein